MPKTHRHLFATLALVLVVPLVAGACLVRTSDGRTLDCRQVTERYRHRGHIGRLHSHTRQVWRCADVTPSRPTTTTTTVAPQAPTITAVVPSYDGTELLLDVTVSDPDTAYDYWNFLWKQDTDAGWSSPLMEYVNDTTIRVHTGLDPRPSAQGTVKVVDDDGLEDTASWSYVHCGGAGSLSAGEVGVAC